MKPATRSKPVHKPPPQPKSNRKRNILLVLLAVGITGAVWVIAQASEYVSINPDMGKLHPIESVSGKTIKQITSEFPAKFEGVNGNNLQIYSFFEKDSVAKIIFGFRDGICKMQVIIPRDNHVLETYIHYFNRHGLEYTQGDQFTADSPHSAAHKVLHLQGNWRITGNGGITNIFMICGEEDENNEPKPVYLINTSMTLDEWLAK